MSFKLIDPVKLLEVVGKQAPNIQNLKLKKKVFHHFRNLQQYDTFSDSYCSLRLTHSSEALVLLHQHSTRRPLTSQISSFALGTTIKWTVNAHLQGKITPSIWLIQLLIHFHPLIY